MEGATSLVGTAITSGITTVTEAIGDVVTTIASNESIMTFVGIGIAFALVSFACSFIPKLRHG